MADKILRRTSYGGEQSETIGNFLINPHVLIHDLNLMHLFCRHSWHDDGASEKDGDFRA